ncbi:hypothetical protein P8452_50700 [Trifolium repens]|nr:hypothetical protein P8452_50700 [Trifolium repens]
MNQFPLEKEDKNTKLLQDKNTRSCYEDSSILSLKSMARLQKASLWGKRPAECLESTASVEVDGGDAYLTKELKMLSLKIEKSERSVPSFDPSHFIN